MLLFHHFHIFIIYSFILEQVLRIIISQLGIGYRNIRRRLLKNTLMTALNLWIELASGFALALMVAKILIGYVYFTSFTCHVFQIDHIFDLIDWPTRILNFEFVVLSNVCKSNLREDADISGCVLFVIEGVALANSPNCWAWTHAFGDSRWQPTFFEETVYFRSIIIFLKLLKGYETKPFFTVVCFDNRFIVCDYLLWIFNFNIIKIIILSSIGKLYPDHFGLRFS